MSKGKQENNATTDTLSQEMSRETAKYLPLREIAKLALGFKSDSLLFQPILDEAKIVHP